MLQGGVDMEVLLQGEPKQMERTFSWPAGAIKRVPTLARITTAVKESMGTFKDAMPIIAVQLSEYMILAWTTAAIGKTFGEVALAGTSLGFMTFNLGFSIQRSFILGLDTQAPQAFGAGRFSDVGLSCQRASVCALVFSSIVGPSMWLLEPLLLAIGQPPETVEFAIIYLRCLSFSLPIHAVFDSAARFLWAQEVLWPPLVSAIAGLLAQAAWMFLAGGGHFGYAGAAFAPMVAYSTMLLTLLGLIIARKPYAYETWPGIQLRRALCQGDGQFGAFVQLSVACAFGESSEWWWWEAVGLHIGTFGPRAAATHAIAYTLVPLLIMIPNSVGICMCNVVGRQLGAGDIKAAKKTAVLALSFGTAIAVAYSSAIFVFGASVASLFTDDEGVDELRQSIWPWATVFLVLDAEFGMLAGLNRALGIQGWSARCVWLCLWMIGTPVIFLLGSDLEHTWYLLPAVYLLFDVALLCCSACTDWSQLAAAAKASAFDAKQRISPRKPGC